MLFPQVGGLPPSDRRDVRLDVAGEREGALADGAEEVAALVVHGDADMAIPMARAEQLAGSLADAELVAVPGAGHAANLTHPQPVNAAIESFLKRID